MAHKYRFTVASDFADPPRATRVTGPMPKIKDGDCVMRVMQDANGRRKRIACAEWRGRFTHCAACEKGVAS